LIKDLTLIAPGTAGSLTIGTVAVKGALEGLDRGRATVSFGYEQSGLKLGPGASVHEFVPERVKLAVAASDLPNAALWAAFKQQIEATGSREEKLLATLQQVQAALIAAGTRLRITALDFDAPAFGTDITGEIRYSPDSSLGVVAGIDAVLRGLDAAMKLVLPAPGAKVDPDTQTLMAMLSMVQAFGAIAKDAAGRDLRTYKIELGADGRLLLNGADMTAVLETVRAKLPALMAKAKGTAPPAKP
jgi:hypothetical protein